MPQDKEKQKIKKELEKHATGYILGGLGLVVGLAWNEAIKALIDYLFPLSKETLLAKFFYAAILTFIIVIATSWLINPAEKSKED